MLLLSLCVFADSRCFVCAVCYYALRVLCTSFLFHRITRQTLCCHVCCLPLFLLPVWSYACWTCCMCFVGKAFVVCSPLWKIPLSMSVAETRIFLLLLRLPSNSFCLRLLLFHLSLSEVLWYIFWLLFLIGLFYIGIYFDMRSANEDSSVVDKSSFWCFL